MSTDSPLFILAGNGSYHNRGCEAILRGTARILRHHFGNPRFLAISSYPDIKSYHEQCQNEYDDMVAHKKTIHAYKRYDFMWFMDKTIGKICPKALKTITYKEMIPYLSSADAVLALKVLAGMDTSGQIRPDYNASGADVNGDNRVGMEEVIYTLHEISELR